MDIKKKDVDALNAVVTVVISKDDYQDKVTKVLNNYKKTANIPGFRKGHIPMGMVKKQYGRGVLVEEVNKLLQEGLHNFLTQEKLDVLGNPLPKNETEINWDTDEFTFEFDLGLSPSFKVDVAKKSVTAYKIVADKEMLDNQVKSIRKQYGTLKSKTEVAKADEITGTFTCEEKGIDKSTTIELDSLKGKSQIKALIGAKPGDVVSLKTKGMFAQEQDNQKHFDVSAEDAKGLSVDVSFKIEEVNTREMADLNQELFDKLFGEGNVTSEKALKEKIKEDAEKQFAQQSDQKMLNDVVESLIENTKFDLPDNFLKKWMRTAGENKLDETEASLEYEKSEKGLRYQLIESKLVAQNNIKIDHNQIKDFSKDLIKTQMKQYGQNNPEEKELESISQRILSNKDEVKRISDQLLSKKLIDLFKSNLKFKNNKVSYEKFIEMAYAKK